MKRLLTLAGLLAVAAATYGNRRRNRDRHDELARPEMPAAPQANAPEQSSANPLGRDAALLRAPPAAPRMPGI